MNGWLGFDLGTQTLGIAIARRKDFIFPRPVFRFPKGQFRLVQKYIVHLMEEENIHHLIFGLPLNMNGTHSTRTESVLRFVHDLKESVPGILIDMTNEQLTTVEAKERLHALGYPEKKQKEFIDSMAAVIILEQFIKNHGN